MHVQLEGRPEWQETLAEQNGIELLKTLYALHHKQDDTRPSMLEVVEQDRQPYLCTQREHQSNVDFAKTFKNAIDAINDSGGWLVPRCAALTSFVKNEASTTRHSLQRLSKMEK